MIAQRGGSLQQWEGALPGGEDASSGGVFEDNGKRER